MAKLRDLNALQKRDMLASSKVSPEELSAYARRYFEEGLFYDAFRFYDRAVDKDGLSDCLRAAIEFADQELLWLLSHSDHIEVSKKEWRACAEKALAMEKPSVARYIYERLGDEDALSGLKGLEPTTAEDSPAEESDQQAV